MNQEWPSVKIREGAKSKHKQEHKSPTERNGREAKATAEQTYIYSRTTEVNFQGVFYHCPLLKVDKTNFVNKLNTVCLSEKFRKI